MNVRKCDNILNAIRLARKERGLKLMEPYIREKIRSSDDSHIGIWNFALRLVKLRYEVFYTESKSSESKYFEVCVYHPEERRLKVRMSTHRPLKPCKHKLSVNYHYLRRKNVVDRFVNIINDRLRGQNEFHKSN